MVFLYVLFQGGPGSVRLRFWGGTVRAVLVFGSGGSSAKKVVPGTVPAVPVPLSVSGKTVPTVPVSGSGSVPEPPCFFRSLQQHLTKTA